MLKRVDKLLIGTDIDRDATAGVTGATIPTLVGVTGAEVMADGEIIVLDKNKTVMAAGNTIADHDTIFIAQGTGVTFGYSNIQDTPFVGCRKLQISDPIEGAKVRSYVGRSYAVKDEKDVTLAAVTAPLVQGTEFKLRIVSKDIKEHPGQFTQTYRFVLGATLTTNALFTGLAAAVNGDSGRRVTATAGATLLLTGLEQPECCTGLTDIDKFRMTDFDVFLTYVDSDGNDVAVTGAAQTLTTALEYGSGNWEQIRDLEKYMIGHMGNTNKTHFPVLEKDFDTVVDSFYDMIVIEHDKSYLAPNNQGVEQTPITTVLAIATATTGINAGNQTATILSVLNPWMASCPGAFANVTV